MRHTKLTVWLLLFALVAGATATPAQQQSTAVRTAAATSSTATLSKSFNAARKAASEIEAEQLRKDLYYIASDQMGGRDTPSPGLDATAQYIANRLKKSKLKLAGSDGTYFQRIPLRGYKINSEKTNARIGDATFRFGEDFVTTLVNGSARGPLVYVGHGWVVKSKNINAYEGVDVRGKIMVVTSTGLPQGVTRAELTTDKQGTEWDDPASYAKRNGATGIVLVPRTLSFELYMARRRTALERGFHQVDSPETQAENLNASGTLPTLMPSDAMLARLFAGEARTAEEIRRSAANAESFRAFDLAPSKTLEFIVDMQTQQASTQNVVAILEGSDPVLKNEYVAIGAHYDHVGTGTPVNGDAIYNGADDDGSGTVAVLAIAEAMAEAKRPRRSVIFVWHAGEEKGLWGSEYFVEHPPVPLSQIVAQLNIDMIGRSRRAGDTNEKNKELSGANEIYLIGSRMMSDALGNLSEAVNKGYLNLNFNYLYDAPNDPNRFFFRSDHYHYARKSIPIIFYFNGVHEDYHRPSDTPDKIDYERMERIARTIFLTGMEIANAEVRPRVDRPLGAEYTR